jgi:hypothetical protein
MKLNLQHYVFFITIGILWSCKRDPIMPPIVAEPKPAKVNWTLHPSTMGKLFITNQFYNEPNQLSIIGTDYTLFLDTLHQVIAQQAFTPARRNLDYLQPFVNKKFFVYGDYERDLLTIYSKTNPNIFKKINIRDFGGYDRIMKDVEPPCAITDDDKMFVPVSDTFQNNQSNYFLVVQLSLDADSIRYRFERRIPIPTTPNQRFVGWSFSTMQPFNSNEIWATGMGMAYHLNSTQNVVTPLYPMLYGKFGYIRDTFFSIGYDITQDMNVIAYNFLPKGQTQWQQQKIIGFAPFALRWYFMENELFAVYEGRGVYHFTKEGNKIQLKLLDSEGLSEIQDITHFKGRVYIASKQGLYYKSLKDFWTYTP